MMIAEDVQSSSICLCEDKINMFKSLSLANYKGENVREYADEAEKILTELEIENQLPCLHLVTILDLLTECSVMDFSVQFMSRCTEIEKFVNASSGKDPATVLAMPGYIHYSTLLLQAKKAYLNLAKKWGASKSKEALVSQVKTLQSEVKNLNQKLNLKDNQSSGNGKSKVTCFNCGEEGHISRNCTKPKKNGNNGGNNNNNNANNGNNNNNNNNQSNNRATSWPAPKDGEPLTKTVNGKEWFYCSKCLRGKGRWNDSHKTDGHKSGFIREQKEKKKENTPNGQIHEVPATTMALNQQVGVMGSSWFGSDE